MRSLIRGMGLLVLVAAVALIGTSQLAMAGNGPWTIEVRGVLVNPAGDEGELEPGGFGNAGAHTIDLMDAFTLQVAVGYDYTDRFSLEAGVLVANHDVELDIVEAGSFDVGETDTMMLELAALWDVAQWSATSFRVGPVIAYIDMDDVDLTRGAVEDGGLTSMTLGNDVMFGVNLRFDTEFGRNGWYFTSNLRWYLAGGPETVLTGYVVPPEGPPAVPAPLAPAEPVTLLSGDVDFEPIVVSLGLGYRY